jgi:hypothetical protein
MCNLYSMTRNREAILRLFRVSHNRAAAYEPRDAIFPGYQAPIVRKAADGERELVVLNWGFVLLQKDKAPKRVTNIRDDKAQTKFWRTSFEQRRCLVPASSYCEPKGEKPATCRGGARSDVPGLCTRRLGRRGRRLQRHWGSTPRASSQPLHGRFAFLGTLVGRAFLTATVPLSLGNRHELFRATLARPSLRSRHNSVVGHEEVVEVDERKRRIEALKLDAVVLLLIVAAVTALFPSLPSRVVAEVIRW